MDSLKKERFAMLCGVIANGIYMIGDWLFNAFGTKSVEVGLAAETGFKNVAMWRLAASIACGGIGVCFLIPAVNAFIRLADRTCRTDKKSSIFMGWLFKIGLYASLVSGFCIHTLCTLIGVIYKSALVAGTSDAVAAEITNSSVATYYVPFFAFYIVLELATSSGYIYKVITKELKLKWPAIFCCSLMTLVILTFPVLSGNQLITDILTARESFGWVLMFVMGYIAVGREEKAN